MKIKHQPRPKWSLKTSFLMSVGIVAVVTPAVLLNVKKSIWTELEIVTGIMALLMFVYFTVLLYLGVRFNEKERAIVDWPVGSAADVWDGSSIPSDGFFTEAGAEAGILGIIVGFLIDLLIALLVTFVICWIMWAGFNVIIAVFIPLYWFHRRSLRFLVTRGRRCRGSWPRSILHGFTTSVQYSFWFYTVFFAADRITRHIGS